MDYKIGTLIAYKTKILRVEKAKTIECNGCFFFNEDAIEQHSCANNTLRCVGNTRKDNTNIIFALL